MKIIIEKYNPKWKIYFEIEKGILIIALAEISYKIEHIGSTSVKGLGAKPVIDIMIGLEDFSLANKVIPKIEKLGYIYVSKYEDVMPYRRFFTKDTKGTRTHHIHMVEIKTDFWKRHLLFRDHLRKNKTDRGKYFLLKKELSSHKWENTDKYSNAKTSFIKSIESKASKAIK